jgi:peptidoglycan/xylan/chitin deacetylase (PgdA/CDA1 family)
VTADPGGPTVAILTYHSISPWTTRSFARWTVDPRLFDEHLAALREDGVAVIPFSAVPDALAAGRRAVAISIDDGFADAGEHAAAALLDHRLPATMFVPSGFVGGSSRWLSGRDAEQPMLSWGAVAELARAGFEIGSHGHMHLAADINPPELVEIDARTSKAVLEDRLGLAVSSFAYPFGYHAGRSRTAIRAAGFAQACAIGDLPARADDDRWALPRLQVWRGTSPEAVLEMVRRRPSGAARRLAHAKQHIWRAGRRWAGWGPLEAGRVEGVLG